MIDRPPCARRDEDGFTLAETLVALAIISVMTAVLGEAVVVDARTQAAMRTRREAVMVAQSQLAQAVRGAGADDGRWGSFSWHVTRTPYGGGTTLGGEAGLQQVEVRVADNRNGRPAATLRTLELGR